MGGSTNCHFFLRILGSSLVFNVLINIFCKYLPSPHCVLGTSNRTANKACSLTSANCAILLLSDVSELHLDLEVFLAPW